MNTINELLANKPICDFCSSKDVVKSYACEPFRALDIPGALIIDSADNAWAACAVCSNLIDTNQWDALTERSIETAQLPDMPEYERELTVQFVRNMHQQFRKLRLKVN
jgi:hypothetical protein